jgi:hypothetical protein
MFWPEVTEALAAIRVLCPSPIPITADTHDAALKVAEQHGFISTFASMDPRPA